MSPKSHHFNPQVYLRQFTNPKAKNELWQYDLSDGSVTESTPKKSGCEDFYHSILRKDGIRDDETVEQAFKHLENRLPKFFETIRNKQPMSDHLWGVLFVFASLQRTRNPKAVFSFQKGLSKAYTQLFKLWKHSPEFDKVVSEHGLNPDVSRKADIELEADRGHVLLVNLKSIRVLSHLFARMKWAFLCAPHDRYFFTSDDPVCCYVRPGERGPFNSVGPAHQRVEITFPLSRRICAVGCWKSCPPLLYNPLTTDKMDVINFRTVQNSFRFVYGPTNDRHISNLVEEIVVLNRPKQGCST
jgi:hypothetical protein